MHFDPDLEERLEAADEAAREMKSNIDGYIEEADIEAPADDQQPNEWAPSELWAGDGVYDGLVRELT